MSNPFRDEGEDAAYSSGATSYGRSDDLEARWAEVERRERDLERREQQLEYRSRKVGDLQDTLKIHVDRTPNWPKCRPMIFHDIRVDIPEEGQTMVKRVYFAWWLSSICMAVNVAGCLSRLIALQSDGGVDFGISIGEGVLGPLIYFVFWYRPLYKAVRRDKSMLYFVFMFCFGWHIIYSVIMAVGIPNSGSSGYINAFQVVNVNVGAFIVMIIASVFWTLNCVFHVWQFKNVVTYYRSKGLHLKAAAEARQAATDGAVAVATSDAGKAAIADAGKAAIAGAAASQSHA